MNTMTRSHLIRRTLAVGLIGSFVLGLGTFTGAADAAHVPKANIRYGDLNLATSQGAKVLYGRIIGASYAVCQSFGRDNNDNADALALQGCRKKIIANAVTKIGKPTLYTVYNARNTKPLQAPIVTADSRR
jgi:UrcA family protein